jgi:hypothetical protein
MMRKHTTIKIWESTRRLLKLAASTKNEPMVELLDRLVAKEADEVGLPISIIHTLEELDSRTKNKEIENAGTTRMGMATSDVY